MRNKILIPGLIIAALAAFFSFRYLKEEESSTVDKDTPKQLIQAYTMNIIKEAHYSPRPLDDKFSEAVFNNSLDNLDGLKKFFTKEDYDVLAQYKDNIDDQLNRTDVTFFNKLNDLFVNAVAKTAKMYPEILSHPFTFNDKDRIQLDPKKLDYAKNDKDLKERFTTYLKYQVLVKYEDLKKENTKLGKDSAGYKPKTEAAMEKEARETILKVQDRYYKRVQKMNDFDRFSIYMNAITAAEDPHTDYMAPETRQLFDESMSGSFIGIGAQLQPMDDGKIKVSMIITGSPSWKQGHLKEGDYIQKVGQGDEKPTEVEGMDLQDVVNLIRGKEGTVVKLYVKHADGSNEVIAITRGKVDLEDTFAKSAIVEQDGKKIGYIYLPEFYADFNNSNNHRSSKDVANEVNKLKAEGVDAIVLDLRNNGGGSLSDVVDIAGLFVDKGPVVQVRGRGGKSVTLPSRAEKAIYTGPLAIMVNGGSASASEIMAAAMQDYHRAVIIGSATYGKGTVQNMLTLDQFVPANIRQIVIGAMDTAKGGDARFDNMGSLKLTIQKFYRINGGSTQMKGVTPDILLPDLFSDNDYMREKKNPSALPWDQIAPASYTPATLPLPLAFLQQNSAKRVAENPTFDLIKLSAARLKQQQDDNWMPLNEKLFLAKQKEAEDLSKKIDEIDSARTRLSVINLKADMERVSLDAASKEKNNKWLNALKKDIYLSETMNVVEDWLNSLKQ